MKGKDIFLGLSYIDGKYVEEAEFGAFTPEKGERAKPRKPKRLRRPLLIAAIVALTALLAGCAVAYALHLRDLKLGTREFQVDIWNEEEQVSKTETVTQNVFSLSGINGSPSYQAAKEWFDFTQSYDPDQKILGSVWGNLPEYPGYEGYNLYSQEMVDKVDEIVAKYHLKLDGPALASSSPRATYRYLGIENVLNPGTTAQAREPDLGWYTEAGHFYTSFDLQLGEETGWEPRVPCVYEIRPKDCFFTQTLDIDDSVDWKEWNYKTAAGDQVLILRAEDYWGGWILCDRSDAMVAVRADTTRVVGTDEGGYARSINTPMTERQIEQLADAINFGLVPKPGDPALLDETADVDTSAWTQTSNGVTVKLKKAETDGLTVRLHLSITASEGVELPQEILPGQAKYLSFGLADFGSSFGPTEERKLFLGGGSGYVVNDGDGKGNTADYILSDCTIYEDGESFRPGDVWNFSADGLKVIQWNEKLAQFDYLWEQEGNWSFDIPFERCDSDCRELQFVSEPLTTSACTGWAADGSGDDVIGDVTVTSLRLRRYTINLTTEGIVENGRVRHPSCDFYSPQNGQYSYIVMKDGSRQKLQLSNQQIELAEPVDLDQVDHILLMDGAKLYPVELP